MTLPSFFVITYRVSQTCTLQFYLEKDIIIIIIIENNAQLVLTTKLKLSMTIHVHSLSSACALLV